MRSKLILLAALAAVAGLPFVIESPYYLHLVQTIAIFSIVVLGLDIVFGYTGEVSLGHAALFGIGAYTAGVLVFHFEDFARASPITLFFIALVLAPIVAAAFGACVFTFLASLKQGNAIGNVGFFMFSMLTAQIGASLSGQARRLHAGASQQFSQPGWR